MTGAALLHAFVLGVEVECRLGNAVSPWHYKRGWHITSTCGVFGAAAAVGEVLRVRRGAHALGARQRVGAIVRPGRDARHDGQEHRRRRRGARRACRPRCSREAGVTGPAEPIAGPRGFASVMGDAREPRRDHQGAGRDLGAHGEHPQAVSVRRGAVSGDRRVPRAARTEPRPRAGCDRRHRGRGPSAAARAHRPARGHAPAAKRR